MRATLAAPARGGTARTGDTRVAGDPRVARRRSASPSVGSPWRRWPPQRSTRLVEAQFMGGDGRRALETFARLPRPGWPRKTANRPGRTIVDARRTGFAPQYRATATASGDRRVVRGRAVVRREPRGPGSRVGDRSKRAWAKASDGRRARRAHRGRRRASGRPASRATSCAGSRRRAGRYFAVAVYDVRGGAPFGAMIEALRSGVDAPGLAGTDPQWLAEVARVVPELRDTILRRSARRARDAPADGWRLFEGVAQVLAALAEEAPVAVIIDDLQWCDADSCALLHSLVRPLAIRAAALVPHVLTRRSRAGRSGGAARARAARHRRDRRDARAALR